MRRTVVWSLSCVGLLLVLWSLPGKEATRAVAQRVAGDVRRPNRVRLSPPRGYVLDRTAPVESRTDGTGIIFVAATAKLDKGSRMVMWRMIPLDSFLYRSEAVDLGGEYDGRTGSLSVESDGNLYLTAWGKAGELHRLRVPGWAAGDSAGK